MVIVEVIVVVIAFVVIFVGVFDYDHGGGGDNDDLSVVVVVVDTCMSGIYKIVTFLTTIVVGFLDHEMARDIFLAFLGVYTKEKRDTA